jgi:hypothetical protein
MSETRRTNSRSSLPESTPFSDRSMPALPNTGDWYPVTCGYSDRAGYVRRYLSRSSGVLLEPAIAAPSTTIEPRCRSYSWIWTRLFVGSRRSSPPRMYCT